MYYVAVTRPCVYVTPLNWSCGGDLTDLLLCDHSLSLHIMLDLCVLRFPLLLHYVYVVQGDESPISYLIN